MPHVERYFAQWGSDSSFEPCLKKSKLDYSALCKKNNTEEYIPLETESKKRNTEQSIPPNTQSQKRNTEGYIPLETQSKKRNSEEYIPLATQSKKRNSEEYIPLETQSQTWSSSEFSETRYHKSDKGEHEKPRVHEDFLNGFDNEAKPGSSRNYSSEAHCSRVDSNKHQEILETPETDKLKNITSEAEFSETSTAFIGPLYQPPPQVESVSRTNRNENSKSNSFRITTVALGKSSRTKGKDAIDYELGQFYKELSELESVTDDHNITQTTVDSQQPFRVDESNAPTIHQVRDHHQQHFTSYQSKVPTIHQVRDQSQQPFSSYQSNIPTIHQVTDQSQKPFSSYQSNAPKIHQDRDQSQQPFSSYQSNIPTIHQVRDQSQQPFSSYQSSIPTIHQVRDQSQQPFSSYQSNIPTIHQIRVQSLQPFSSYQMNAPTIHQVGNESQQPFRSYQSNVPTIQQVRDQSQQHFSSYQSNTPTIHQVRDHQSQKSSSQLCNSLPSTLLDFIPPSYHPSDSIISPAERPALPPNTNQDSCDRPVPFDRTNSCFVRHSLPLPGFQGPLPPAFVVHNGPFPPKCNYPMNFPREENIRSSPYHENEKYHSVNDDDSRHTTQAPWHNSHVPPENKFSPQGRGYTEPFPRPTVESPQQTYQREDFCEQKDRRFSEKILPHGVNVPHERCPPRFSDEAKYTDMKRTLVLLRGVPGSGKSTLARTLLDQSPDGIVFSTDDYFCQENGYTYDVKLLGDAHNWNQNRARRAMDDERSPIIIDNTNIQAWEMKAYVQMAIEKSYGVEFLEPNTWWKLDPHELEKRNTHRVPREKISQMLERFEHDMNVEVVMNSVEPRRVRPSRPPIETRQRWGASVDCTLHSTSFQIR